MNFRGSLFATSGGGSGPASRNREGQRGLEQHLRGISYDEVVATQRGARLVTGTGKAKKSGVAVVFATAVFDVSGQVAGAAFVVDARIEDLYKEATRQYKEAIRQICQTIRVGDQSAAKK